ncbi:MAG: DeoR/GlpR family DNA-binding transcription regulator [Planctomycetota bacterium]
MSRSSAQAHKRRRELFALLLRHENISTSEMALRFRVNPMTIRRDLKLLEESGHALRSYGGAVAAQRITFEFAFDQRRRNHLAEKQRIGAAAAAMIEEGQTLFIDTGTTTLMVAKALARATAHCTVVTSSLVIASELWTHSSVELVLLGGRVRQGSPDLVGPGTEMMLDRLTADIAFLGSDGIDLARGSFAGDIEAARVAQRMAASARRVVIVADSSKLGVAGAACYMKSEEMQELITDRGADPSVVAELVRRGVRVTLV